MLLREKHMSENNSVRLNKYISESGICSRREADRYIERGNVFINGKMAKIGDQVFPGDRVMVNGNNIEPREEENFILIAFNKPVGITSTTEASVRDNIVDYVNHSDRIFPIGRLDKDSQGLIFLTNNGDIVNKILRAGNKHEKEYLVTVDKPITDQFIESMASGVPILGVMTRKCKVSKESTFVFKITLIQGLNRQIRRMCEYFDYEVVKLERTRIMNVSLKGLPIGEWRELTEEERSEILKSVKDSSSDHKEKQAKRESFKGDPKEEPKQRNNPDKRFGGGQGAASRDQHKTKRAGGRHSSAGSAAGPSRKPGKSSPGGRNGGKSKGRQR